MVWVFVVWSCRPCAVVAVVRSSSMVVVCSSEPLMRRMSSANLTMERSVLGPCSASQTPWLHLLHFSAIGFMMYCWSKLNKGVLSGWRGGTRDTNKRINERTTDQPLPTDIRYADFPTNLAN